MNTSIMKKKSFWDQLTPLNIAGYALKAVHILTH